MEWYIYLLGIIIFARIMSYINDRIELKRDTDDDYDYDGALDDAISYAYINAYPNGCYHIVTLDVPFGEKIYRCWYKGSSRPIKIEKL